MSKELLVWFTFQVYNILPMLKHFTLLSFLSVVLLNACSQNPGFSSETRSVAEGFSLYERGSFSFEYPSDWKLEEQYQGTGGPASGMKIELYNFPSEVLECPSEKIRIVFDGAYWYDTEFLLGPSFEDMVKSNELYAGMEPELGKWSGELVETTIGGKKAFQVDDLGLETGCSSKDYIVDTREGHYMTIDVSAGDADGNDKLVKQILDSVVFEK